MMAKMRIHVSKAHDLVTEMTFGCSAAIRQFVWREAGEEKLRGLIIRVAFLWNL
jgi:hypothetical protein